jgi:predicted dehydrogenase
MTQDTVSVGVIGLGWPGHMHLQGMESHPRARVVAAADKDPDRCANAREKYGLKRTYLDYREMLDKENLDAVGVALPNYLHAPATIACLEAGAHVLCEKPPAMSATEAGAMRDVSVRTGKLLMFGVQRRFAPAVRASRQAVREGRLGEVFHARTRCLRARWIPLGTDNWFVDPARSGGGSLIDIGVHMLDVAWHLLGHPTPSTVSAAAYQKFAHIVPVALDASIDDSVFAWIRFEGGASLMLSASWGLNPTAGDPEVDVILYGTRASLDMTEPNDPCLVSYDEQKLRRVEALELPDTRQGYELQMHHFVDCITNNTACLSTADQGVVLMTMLDAIYASARTGREIVLDETG